MSFIKRFTQLLTPPPRKADKAFVPEKERVEARSWEVPETISTTKLKSLLKELLAGTPMDDAKVRRDLEELKELAAKHGKYVTASEIQNCLRTLPSEDKEGRLLKKTRGYELAADLYMQNLQKLINEIETKRQRLGPTVFDSYCDELVDCLFAGDKDQKAVESVVLLVDTLLGKILDHYHNKDLYAGLAEQAVKSVMDESSHKLERDTVEDRRDSRLRRDGKDIEERETPRFLNDRVIEYLDEFKKEVGLISKQLAQYSGQPAIAADDSEAFRDKLKVKHQMEFLSGLARLSTSMGYPVFQALVLERVVALRNAAQLGGTEEFLTRAARDYETQGDREKEWNLEGLARHRYRKAFDHYRAANQIEGAAAVKAKALGQVSDFPSD